MLCLPLSFFLSFFLHKNKMRIKEFFAAICRFFFLELTHNRNASLKISFADINFDVFGIRTRQNKKQKQKQNKNASIKISFADIYGCFWNSMRDNKL